MSKLTQSEITNIAKSVGMSDPVKMAAIAMAESSGDTTAHNTNAKTGDDSYGLWQINMRGSLGPARRKAFGITSNDQLFNPVTNAKAAKKILDSQGLGAWSTYTNGAYEKFYKGTAEGAGLSGNPTEDVANNIIGRVPGVAQETALANIANDIGKATIWISTPSNWVRVLYVIGGAAALIAGIVYISKDTSAGKAIISKGKTAAKTAAIL